MVNIKEVEKNLTEQLKNTFIGKEFIGEVFPFALAEGTSQYIAPIVGNYLNGLAEFNIKPIKEGNMLMVSVTDADESTIADIMFTVEFPEKNKEDHLVVKNILCSLKEYVFEKNQQA